MLKALHAKLSLMVAMVDDKKYGARLLATPKKTVNEMNEVNGKEKDAMEESVCFWQGLASNKPAWNTLMDNFVVWFPVQCRSQLQAVMFVLKMMNDHVSEIEIFGVGRLISLS